MPDANAFFPASGDWIKVEDLQGKAIRMTISAVVPTQVKKFGTEDQMIPALEVHFEGTDKVHVLKSRFATEATIDAYGPNTEQWVGRKAILKPTTHTSGKKFVAMEPDVQVADGGLGGAPAHQDAPQVPGIDEPSYPAEPAGYDGDDMDSDVPF